MSGDVQPRKRKDKRKKQREDDESSHGVHITKMGSDDVHLHVHHEHGTGGHWCAKIFFFTLLAVLVGLISLIIMENRGSSDLDTPLSESRFSNYFDGWVDEKREAHDEHDAIQASLEEHDEHDEPFEEEEALSEGDEEEEEYHEEEEEEDGDEDDEHDEQVTKEEYDEATQEDTEGTLENEDDDEDADNDDDENATNEAAEVADTVEEEEEDDENDDEDDNDNDDTKKSVEEEEIVSMEFTDHTAELNDADGDEDDGDENDNNDGDDNEDENGNTAEAKTQEDNNNSADPFDEDDDDDDDGTFELFEKIVDNDAEELLLLQKKAQAQAAQKPVSDTVASEENEETEAAEEKSSWLSSLAVKLGVGVALALVARLVLLRKNPNTNEAPTEAMMKRRLTIAGPDDTFPEDVDAPLLPTDELSDEEEIIEEEIIEFLEEEVEEEVEEEEEIDVDDDGVELEMHGKYVPETFEQLEAMYRKEKEPSPHLSAEHQPHIVHTPEIEMPDPFAETSSKDVPSSNQKSPPVFIAPPPPKAVSLNKADQRRDFFTTATNRNVLATGKPIETPADTKRVVEETSPSQVRKRTVTHDVDYQPDADEQAYDDEVYSDEMDEEDEVDDDGDEDDEDISDIDDISDVDDTELMNRLEAKYGKLPPTTSAAKEYESDEDPDDPTWTQIKPKETVDGGGAKAFDEDEEDSFEAQLNRAQEELARENFAAAFRAYSKLAKKHPDQPQTFYGQCKAFYEYIKSRNITEYTNVALNACKRYLAFGQDVEDREQYRLVAEIALEIINDLDVLHQAEEIFDNLLQFFPQNLNYMKRYAVILIKIGRLHRAKKLLLQVLQTAPNDGLASAYYGFVLVQLNVNQTEAIKYLKHGLESNERGVQQSILYLKLGEAYQRLENTDEAYKVYERAVELKLLPSIMQRAIYYVPHLRARPFWSIDETTYTVFLNSMQNHWRAIREEGIRSLKMDDRFKNETENLRHFGTWQMFDLWARGRRNEQNCKLAPFTCALIAEFPAAHSCLRGQVKFSVMLPKTHIWPHCGPTNARLRGHLGLVVPEDAEIRVGNEKRTWTEGEFLIFDDSFEHEVWQNGDSYRLVLIVDMWHPDLSEEQRHTLTPL